MNTLNQSITKPGSVKAIQILTIFKVFLSLTFYLVFKFKAPENAPIPADYILYTFFGYVVMAAVILYAIAKRNMALLRIGIVLDFVVSIPTRAYIGFVIAAVNLILTFNAKTKGYLQ